MIIIDKKRFVFFAIALFFLLAVTATAWTGYKKISDKLASVKSEIASVKSEIASVKSEIDKRKDFIPPLFGARHVALRKRFALDQISQADGCFILVIGDSIIEGMNLPTLAGVPAINAGIGGGGILEVSEFLAEVQPGAAIIGILIAIGVNDSVQGPTSPQQLAQWVSTFKNAISKAKILARNNVAVSTVIPVEIGKPLGDQYFDPQKIVEINRFIRNVCAESKITLVEQSLSFNELATSGVEYTTDGVHLNSVGYQLMKSNIRKAIRW